MLPSTRRVAFKVTAPAVFAAVHLYSPSIFFVTFFKRRIDPPRISLALATTGRSSSVNVQENVGFGTPVALHLILVVLPSRTVWFSGDRET